MNPSGVVVRDLAPELIDDYLTFFDKDAFADFPWWSGCYCTFYRDPSHDGDSSPERIAVRRPKAIVLVRGGLQRGHLAYLDGRVVGWCNADVRDRYAAPRGYAKAFEGDGSRIGAIFCFVVAAPHRGQGVATALLDAACDGFRRLGLVAAEGYPPTKPPTGPYAAETPWSAHNYHGPLSMYLKAGFHIHREMDRFAVVRKDLASR